MRILYVINSLDGGGGALPLPRVVDVLRSAGHEVGVVSLMERDGRARPALEAAGITYEVIGGPRRRYLQTAQRLDRIVRRVRPDLLWTSLTHATVTGQLVGRLRGVPVVSWLHNAWLKPANEQLLRATAGLTTHWVADSETVAAFGRDRLGLDPARVGVWPLYVADPAVPTAQPWQSGPFRVGSLGRLHRNKGYDVLIRALAHINEEAPDVASRLSVHIAGEGPQRRELETLAAHLGVSNLHFCGFTDDPSGFLAGVHGYVQPSHHEGLCISAHQAMAAGLSVIASPVGEMQRSVTANDGGTLVAYGDVEGLAAALCAMVADPSRASAVGRRSRSWVLDQFSAQAFALRGCAIPEIAKSCSIDSRG